MARGSSFSADSSLSGYEAAEAPVPLEQRAFRRLYRARRVALVRVRDDHRALAAEAAEALPDLGQSAHDWLVETALGLLEPELELGVVVDAAVVVVVAAVVVVVVAPLAAATVVVVLRDSTGSCPLASVTVISSQVATNSAAAAAAIRRWSRRARRARAAFRFAALSSMPVASLATIAIS